MPSTSAASSTITSPDPSPFATIPPETSLTEPLYWAAVADYAHAFLTMGIRGHIDTGPVPAPDTFDGADQFHVTDTFALTVAKTHAEAVARHSNQELTLGAKQLYNASDTTSVALSSFAQDILMVTRQFIANEVYVTVEDDELALTDPHHKPAAIAHLIEGEP